MTINIGQLIVWLIVGALAGSVAGIIVTGNRRGFGQSGNILIGLIGAIVGGVLFNLLGINLGLGDLVFSAEDVVAAIVGALVVLLVLSLLRR